MKLTRKRTPYLLLRYIINPFLNNAILVTLDETTLECLKFYKSFINDAPDILKRDMVIMKLKIHFGDYLYIDDMKYPQFKEWLMMPVTDEQDYHFIDATPEDINNFVLDSTSDNATYYASIVYPSGNLSLMLVGDDDETFEFVSQPINASKL